MASVQFEIDLGEGEDEPRDFSGWVLTMHEWELVEGQRVLPELSGALREGSDPSVENQLDEFERKLDRVCSLRLTETESSQVLDLAPHVLVARHKRDLRWHHFNPLFSVPPAVHYRF